MRTAAVLAISMSGVCWASAGEPPAEWIWFPEGDPRTGAPSATRCFRKTFKIVASKAKPAAWAWIAADNAYELYLNGTRIGAGNDWQHPGSHDLSSAAKAGENILAIKATNGGGPAGVLCAVAVVAQNGTVTWVCSDASWKASDKAPDGWMKPGFKDASWPVAKSLGKAPLEPWPGVKPAGVLLDADAVRSTITPNGDGLNDQATVAVSYVLGKQGQIDMRIVDSQGKAIHSQLAKGKVAATFVWKGTDKSGKAVPAGSYKCVVTAKAGGHSASVERPLIVKSSLAFKIAPNTMKGVFPIGVWYDGRVEGINCPEGFVDVPKDMAKARSYYERTFKDIKDHGIEVVVIPNTPPDYRETLLTTADTVGVKIVLELAEVAWPEYGGELAIGNPKMTRDEVVLHERLRAIVTPLGKHPSLMAYQLIDEPPASLFGNWRTVNRILGHIDPKRPAFSCLCRQGELHRTSGMGTQMIVFDRYPIGAGSKPGDYDWQKWIALLETLRRHADANRIPFWIVLQTCAKPGAMRFPTPAELRVMTYLSLAHNAKGVFFFLYNSMTQQERLQGLVDVKLEPVPLYDTVAALSGELGQLAPVLLGIKPTDNIVSVTAKVDVQTFLDGKGRRHIFVTNLDVLRSVKFNAMIELPTLKGIKEVLTGTSVQVVPGGAPKKHSFSMTLGPGDGKLLVAIP